MAEIERSRRPTLEQRLRPKIYATALMLDLGISALNSFFEHPEGFVVGMLGAAAISALDHWHRRVDPLPNSLS